MLGTKVRQETLLLSLGQTWVAVFFPKAGRSFPPGTTAETTIADPAGNVIATWPAITVTDTRIDFVTASTLTDGIPHGSYFTSTAHYPAIGSLPPIDEVLSRGMVVRDDNPTPLAGPRTTNIALSFSDDMAGPAVDPNWVRVGGTGKFAIWDNSLASLPNGMAGDFVTFTTAAGRYRAQTNQNAVKVEVTTTVAGFAAAGKTTVIVASNQAMTSWVGFQFVTDSLLANKKLTIVRGTAPTVYTIQTSVNNTVADLDRYTFVYDDLADKYLAYKGTSLTPLLQWTDTGHVVAHGNGYRYPALLFESSLFTTGVQLSGWSIKDN